MAPPLIPLLTPAFPHTLYQTQQQVLLTPPLKEVMTPSISSQPLCFHPSGSPHDLSRRLCDKHPIHPALTCAFLQSLSPHSSWSSIISLIKSRPFWKPCRAPPRPRSQPNENQTPGLQAAGARMGPHPPPLISPRPPAFPHRALVPWPPHSASHMTSSLPPRSFHGGFSMPSGGSSPVALYGSLLLLDVCFESSPFHSF